MAAHVTLIPGTSILEYRFTHDLNLDDYRDCMLRGSYLVDQLPDGPIYALVDVRTLRTVPFNVLQTTRQMRLHGHRTEGVAVVGANAFIKMLARMTIRLLKSREIDLIFCDSHEEAFEALNQVASQEWTQLNAAAGYVA
jgi:hypothetical protein